MTTTAGIPLGGCAAEPAVVETHVSTLMFLDGVVCKFKKALRLPFIDFTTAESRLAACEAEVEANRRLSPDVYLGVATLSLDGHDLDHAVVMRRLPAERNLEALARTRPRPFELGLEVRRLARLLASFHAGAARSPAIDDASRPEALEATWRSCLEALAPFAGSLVDARALDDVRRQALAFVAGRGPLFMARIAEGRVCDGHGDLIARDVFLLDDGPRVLDCIEFDPALRHVDVAADVAFLVMDLERLGAVGLAQAFLDAYEEAAGERFPSTLLHHYCAERAVVRAEVACLRAAQSGDDWHGAVDAGALLGLAREHLRFGRVVLGVVSGLPGTGKSSLASAIAGRLGWPVLRSDEIRRALFCPGWQGSLGELPAPVPGLYGEEATQRTYGEMLERAEGALGMGESVLLDATFAPEWARRRVEELAHAAHSDLVVLECEAPPVLTTLRLRARRAAGTDASGADEAVAAAMARSTRPWPVARRIDTTRPPDDVLEEALHALRQLPSRAVVQ